MSSSKSKDDTEITSLSGSGVAPLQRGLFTKTSYLLPFTHTIHNERTRLSITIKTLPFKRGETGDPMGQWLVRQSVVQSNSLHR